VLADPETLIPWRAVSMTAPDHRERHRTWRLVLLGALLCCVTAACPTPRFIPRHPLVTPKVQTPRGGGLRVKQVTISCRRRGDYRGRGCGKSPELIALASHLGSGVERALPARDPASAPVEAEVDIEAVHSSRQTVFFDALNVLSAGHFPLVPQWGEATLLARIRLSRLSLTPASAPASMPAATTALPEDSLLGVLRIEVKVPYKAHWYSWYRADEPGRAFAAGWKVLAEQMVVRLAAALRDGLGPAGPPVRPWTEPYPDAGGNDELGGVTTRSAGAGPPSESSTIVLERSSEWRLLTRPAKQKTTARGLLHKYLSAFSGLEAGYFLGKAWVQSEARDSFGASYTVASGEASSRGYRIGFYTIPEKSDWFIFPTLGFFSLDIDIHDFRENIPLVTVPGATAIPGRGSDPETGAPIDLGDPNIYRLELRSAYLGQRLSGTLVYGTPSVQIFGTLEGGLNIFEVRHTRVYLGNWTNAGYSAAWVRSGALRGIVGLAIRPWHIALRCEANYEAYFTFSFPEEIEFMGRVEHNPTTNHYERRRTYVRAASSGTANVFFSANLYY
jgi:hypothetical protein